MKAFKAATLALLFALCCATAGARQLPEAKLTPAPPTERQAAAVREGVALHDRGDYDGAIRKYEEALAENPSNTLALYEMSYSYSAKKDYRKSLEVAYRGAQYKSDELRGFYLLIGNDLDLLGNAAESVEVYKRALKVFPDEALLHFNLAVAYGNSGKNDEAKKSLKAAVSHDPLHPGSHLLLARVFYQTGYKTPALLAAARFLTLEADSKRAGLAVRIVSEVLGGGATPGKKPNEVNIFMDVNTKKDEGDFGTVEVLLGLSAATSLMDKEKKTEAQRLVSQMEKVVSVLAEQSEKRSQGSFVQRYYVPYFAELKRRGHAEAFAYNALRGSGLPGVREWVESNSGRVMQFLIWSKGYEWPKDLKP